MGFTHLHQCGKIAPLLLSMRGSELISNLTYKTCKVMVIHQKIRKGCVPIFVIANHRFDACSSIVGGKISISLTNVFSDWHFSFSRNHFFDADFAERLNFSTFILFLSIINLTGIQNEVIKAVCQNPIIGTCFIPVILIVTLLHFFKIQSDYKLFSEEKNG